MRSGLILGILAAGSAAVSAAFDAAAQDVPPGSQSPSAATAPMSQNMGDLLAASGRDSGQGVRIGAFILLPTGGVTAVYDDNVYALPSNARGDLYTNVEAQVSVVSNWSRHALELYAGGGANYYDDFSDENKGYARLGIGGRLDVRRDLWVEAYARYAFGYEARGAGESFAGLGNTFEEPVETQTVNGGVLVHKAFNRLWAEIGGSVRRQTYFDARIAGVGTVDQSFRDGTVDEVLGRAGYEFSPRTSAFIEAVSQRRNFEDSRFDGDGYRLLGGVRYELTRLINAEIAAGYMSYDSADALRDIDTWTFRTQVRYDVTPLLSLGLVGGREAGSPSQFGTGSNRLESEIGVRADYAVRRDVTLMAGAGYGWVEYVDTTRKDEYLRLTAGIDYALRPWATIWANYSFLDYDSNIVPSIDYDKSLFFIGLSARY